MTGTNIEACRGRDEQKKSSGAAGDHGLSGLFVMKWLSHTYTSYKLKEVRDLAESET